MDDESGAWFTYAEVADRLGVTPEAARSRAKRLGWRRQLGNDGRALVWAALEHRPPGDHPITARLPPARRAVDPALMTALESQNNALQGELAGLREALTEARARANAAKEQLAAAEAREAGLAGDLTAERARTSQAIAAFADLASKLTMLAEERQPWWRRLRRRG